MMNRLLSAMADDMKITRFTGELDESYIYRLCYSALGQWCLKTSQNNIGGQMGSTKHNQTIVINELLRHFIELFPFLEERFTDANDHRNSSSVHIRRVYEETGYLLTDDSNRNIVAYFGRSIAIGSANLLFGLPSAQYGVNGLGVYATPTEYIVSSTDFLIRDTLTPEEYFGVQFDPVDFDEKDIDSAGLEFFNPLSSRIPSLSWTTHMETDCTVARKKELGTFYRVIRTATGSTLVADEPLEVQDDKFTSYEYRRLYFALKYHYGKPLEAVISAKDDEWSTIRIKGRLPNREYYYLLLMAWPFHGAFDRVQFVIRNDFIPEITSILENLGIKVKEGINNAE